jgi:tryptophan halogenase
MAVPDSLTERLDLFASSGRFYKRAAAELFRVESWVQVLLGQGFAMGHDPNAAIMPAEVRTSFLADIEEVIADAAGRMPDHAAFIDRYCKAPAIVP